MVPRPAGTAGTTGTGAYSPWVCSDGDSTIIDDAFLHHHEEEEKEKEKKRNKEKDGTKKQEHNPMEIHNLSSTPSAAAASEQDEVDEWGASARQQQNHRWQPPRASIIPASVRSSNTNGSHDVVPTTTTSEEEATDPAGSHGGRGNHWRPVDAQVTVMNRGDGRSRSNRHPDSDSDNGDARWPCPRCTLYNPTATTKCVACNFKQQTTTTTRTTSTAIHPQDPVRRERLLPHHHQQQQQRYRYRRSTDNHRNRRSRLLSDLERELLVESNSNGNTSGTTTTSARSIASRAAATSTFAPSFQPQQSQSQSQQGLYHTAAQFVFSGALVGGLLGLAGAYLQGENSYFVYPYTYSYAGITSYSTFWAIMFEVTLSGAIAGAVVHNFLEQERAIRRARLDSSNSRSQEDTDDPTVAFIMQSMETSSRLSSRQMTQAIGEDGNSGRSSSMMSYEYFLNSTVGGGGGSGGGGADNGGSETNESSRAAVEEDIHSLPTVQVQDTDPDKLPQDCRRCAICLDAFLPGSFRKTLPCWHGFHTQCVDKWLRTVGSCPICKHRIGG
jgi:hypothetical protein